MVSETAAIMGQPNEPRAIAPVWHTLMLLIILLGWAMLGYKQAGTMRAESTPPRMELYVLTMVAEWILFGYVVFGIKRKKLSLRVITGPKWRDAREVLTNVGIALLFWIVSLGVLALVALALRLPTHPAKSLQFMVPHTLKEMCAWALLAITAGICEETVFRGYLQQQFIAWTRSTPAGLILSAVVFGAGHIYQGLRQAILIAVFGALFGILAAFRRDIKPGMVTHAWQDGLSGLAQFLLAKGHVQFL